MISDDGKEMKILWETNRWDGPLSGMCWYNGRLRWFHTYEMGGWVDEDTCEPRRYHIHKLPFRAIVTEAFFQLSFYIWVKTIKYGWRNWYKVFGPHNPDYKNAPVIGEVVVK